MCILSVLRIKSVPVRTPERAGLTDTGNNLPRPNEEYKTEKQTFKFSQTQNRAPVGGVRLIALLDEAAIAEKTKPITNLA